MYQVWNLSTSGEITKFVVEPEKDFGLPSYSLDEVRSGTAEANATIFRQLLGNELKRDHPVEVFTILNAACLLVVAGKAADLKEGVKLARESIASGSAARVLDGFRQAAKEGVANAKIA